MITNIDQLSPDVIYTYADYLSWHFKERVELIQGKFFKMSPAPSRMHQRISANTLTQIANFLQDKDCQVYSAPFDVRLVDARKTKSDEEILTVVQPDICVICDRSKLDDRGCLGTPDWIIEILSPGNNKKELDYKFQLYEKNGVREYWLIHPSDQTVVVFELKEEKYELRKIYASDEEVASYVLPALIINLPSAFKD